jgi:hypothetical protein
MSIEPVQYTKTSELDKRFNIGKNTRVNRLAMLGLTPDRLVKEGKYYLLTAEQVELFTDFDRYILETGSPDGYPRLLSNYSDNTDLVEFSTEIGKELTEDGADDEWKYGQLATMNPQKLDGSIEQHPDILTGVTGEFTGVLPQQNTHSLTEHLVKNAQRKATAMMIAENVLADQYINNPHLLSADLRAQVDSIQFATIDPKELAASLVATAQRQMKAA